MNFHLLRNDQMLMDICLSETRNYYLLVYHPGVVLANRRIRRVFLS